MNVPTFLQLCGAAELSKELICKLMEEMESDQIFIDQIDTVINSVIDSGIKLVNSEDHYESFEVVDDDVDVLVDVEYLDYLNNVLKLSVTFRIEGGTNIHLCISNGVPTMVVYVNDVVSRRFKLSNEYFVKTMLLSAMVYLVFISFYPDFMMRDTGYLDLMENHLYFNINVNEILSHHNRETKSSTRFTPY